MTAQTQKLDSLRQQFYSGISSKERLATLIKICEAHPSLSKDSLQKFIGFFDGMVVEGSPEAFRAKNFYSIYLGKNGDTETAIQIVDSLLRVIPTSSVFRQTSLYIKGNRAVLLIRKNEPKEAIKQIFNYLEDAEKSHDSIWVIRAYTALGWANMEIGQYYDAIKWLNIGKALINNPNVLAQSSALFANLASSYNNINQRDSAFFNIEIALAAAKKYENLSSIANILNIRSEMYLKEENESAAEKDMTEALKVREQIGDALYVISDMATLSSFYASINQTDKGIEIAKKGIGLAEKSNNLSQLIFLNNALGENYLKAKRIDDYASTLNVIINLKDSLYKNNSEDAIAELETKYELQKKENIIIQQNYKLTRNRYITIISSVLFILGSFVIWLLYRNYVLVQKRKMAIAIAEQRLLANEAVKQAEENERKRIAADLHDNLGSFAAAIKANVKYLKEGQNVDHILTQLDENAQSMVIQLSDTIWILKNEHLPITKLADRFKAWMQRLIQNYPHIKYHYSEEIENDIEFTPSKILNVFLILKECITNSLKHSNCTDIKITFTSTENWVITIEDNGKGFNPEHVEKGSGVNNIIHRATTSGWIVEWLPLQPTGTLFKITEGTTK